MPSRATTSPWQPLPKRRTRAESKHDHLCVTNPDLPLLFCWCVCPKCWDSLSRKCVCYDCRCRRHFTR